MHNLYAPDGETGISGSLATEYGVGESSLCKPMRRMGSAARTSNLARCMHVSV